LRRYNTEMSGAFERWQNWAEENAALRDMTERALKWW
jgi:hypothetical protein